MVKNVVNYTNKHADKTVSSFQQYPVRYNVGSCGDRGPAIPIVYDHGDKESTRMLYGPNSRSKKIMYEENNGNREAF